MSRYLIGCKLQLRSVVKQLYRKTAPLYNGSVKNVLRRVVFTPSVGLFEAHKEPASS